MVSPLGDWIVNPAGVVLRVKVLFALFILVITIRTKAYSASFIYAGCVFFFKGLYRVGNSMGRNERKGLKILC